MSSFWTDGKDEHQEIAKTFYQNIEYRYDAYDYVTSRRMCPCLDYKNTCSFPLNGKVERIEYRGPPVSNL
jgi:hypothetical protein